MKVKLIKVLVESSSNYCDYNYDSENDYGSLYRHFSEVSSPWTEVSPDEHFRLLKFLKEKNNQSLSHYYALIEEKQELTVEIAIEEMIKAEEEKRRQELLKEKKKKEEWERKEKARLAETAAKTLARKQKQLEKLKKELEIK